jgi:integrase
MAGNIVKKGDRKWLVRIFLGRDAQTGKKRLLNKVINGTKKDAEKFCREQLLDRDRGTLLEPSNLTINEFLDQWIETAARPRLRERTLADYVEKIDREIRPALGWMKLSNVRPLHIQALCSKLQERGLSARSVRYIHTLISSCLKHAVKLRMIPNNPAEVVELPRIERKEMRALSKEEAGRFLAEAEKDKHGVVFAFALATAMRPEEYLALQWKDIDFGKGTATVQRTLVWRKGG